MEGPSTSQEKKVPAKPKELFEVPGASHVDLYDKDEFVTPAVEAIDRFFGKHGGSNG